jgi:hypothetical protein
VPYPSPTFAEKQDLLRTSPRLESPCRDFVRMRYRGLYRAGADLLSSTEVGGAARRSSLQASRVSRVGLSGLILGGQPSRMFFRFLREWCIKGNGWAKIGRTVGICLWSQTTVHVHSQWQILQRQNLDGPNVFIYKIKVLTAPFRHPHK